MAKPATPALYGRMENNLTQSSWWENLQDCPHTLFLMLGEAYIEKILEQNLNILNIKIKRGMEVSNLKVQETFCVAMFSNHPAIQAKYIIGADGAQPFTIRHFNIPFEVEKPEINLAIVI